MPKFLVSVLRPSGWTGSDADAAMGDEIDALNDAMVEAGVRVFVGGLKDPGLAVEIGSVARGDQFLNGLWVLECASLEEASDWGRRASEACRASVEVREFH
jgi:hypothetical protein